jgi:hypothetical protein
MKITIILLFSFFCTQLWALPELDTLIRQSNEVNWDNGVTTSIVINAPVEVVWKYASDSTKAKEWSVYFDHISPLPGKFKDGQVGSLRRCFRNADETGPRWDEVTIDVQPLKSRKIVTYNFTNYPYPRLSRHQYAFVRQLYRAIDANHTEMSFQTIRPRKSSLFWKYIFHITRDDVEDIFYKNLENTKAIIEGQTRLHPWQE